MPVLIVERGIDMRSRERAVSLDQQFQKVAEVICGRQLDRLNWRIRPHG